MVLFLEARQLKATDPRHTEARNEALKLTERLNAYLQAHQGGFNDDLTAVFKKSPLWIEPTATAPTPAFENNAPGNAMFVTPELM